MSDSARTPTGKLPRFTARVFFLARRNTLREKVTAGYSLRQIYDEENVSQVMGYRQFVRYVGRFLPEESRLQRWSAQRGNDEPISRQSESKRAADSVVTAGANPPAATRGPKRFVPHQGPARRETLW
jgi:hypothetical protein